MLQVLKKTKVEVTDHLKKKALKLHKADEDDADDIIKNLPMTQLSGLKKAEDELGDVATDGGERFLLELNVPALDDVFGQVSDRAVAYASARGAELVTEIDDSTRSMLARTLAEGLEANKGLDYIIELIEKDYAFSEDRAELIARTEVAMANGWGTLEGMRKAESTGLNIKKVWLPDDIACDECKANGDQGPIPLDELFQDDSDTPPGHPNCRCDMASDVEDPDADESDAGAED